MCTTVYIALPGTKHGAEPMGKRVQDALDRRFVMVRTPRPQADRRDPTVQHGGAPLLASADETRWLLGGISKRKLALMVASGEVQSTKIGTRRMFPLEGLKAFVVAKTEGGR